MKHPRQPIILDEHGTARFQANAVVRWMLAMGRKGQPFDLNDIAELTFPREDMVQLMQLIGYSVSAYGSLSYPTPEDIAECDQIALNLIDPSGEPTK